MRARSRSGLGCRCLGYGSRRGRARCRVCGLAGTCGLSGQWWSAGFRSAGNRGGRSCCGGARVSLNQSRAPAGVPCCGLALHFGFGLSPQPTDARCARGEELQGERTLLRGQIDARRGKAGCVGPVRGLLCGARRVTAPRCIPVEDVCHDAHAHRARGAVAWLGGHSAERSAANAERSRCHSLRRPRGCPECSSRPKGYKPRYKEGRLTGRPSRFWLA